MLDVKEAARRASEYFAGLYSDQKIHNVQLEEVEADDGVHKRRIPFAGYRIPIVRQDHYHAKYSD